MQIKSSQYKIRGMNKDLSYSAFNPEYSWHNHNVRLTARDGNDLLSITNERGNASISFFSNVVYSYHLLFGGYSDVLEPPTYNYSLSFFGYQDTLDPPTYNYSLSFSGYKDVLDPPVYSYQLQFSSYSDTLIEGI